MNSNQSYCLGSRHFSQTVNQSVFDKVNPKTQKLGKKVKGTCSICVLRKSQSFAM